MLKVLWKLLEVLGFSADNHYEGLLMEELELKYANLEATMG